MASSINATMTRIQSALLATGIFLRVDMFEAQSSPGKELTASLFFKSANPIEMSLANATSLYVYMIRIYADQLKSPTDSIDAEITEAVDKLFDIFAGDFTISDNVREIDFLGEFGTPLHAEAGYIEIGSNPNSRIVDITLPLVVNDTLTFGG